MIMMFEILPEGIRFGGKLLGNMLLGGWSVILCIPIVVLFGECWAAIWHQPSSLDALNTQTEQIQDPEHDLNIDWQESATLTASFPTASSAVLLPAHNEAIGLAATLATISPQLQPDDRLVVVADNCTDETAAIARRAGAEVIERQDSEHRGKGYALDFGLRYLAQQPPAVVILVDADCRVAPGSLGQLTAQVMRTQCPAQAINMLAPPAQATPRDAISALAFTLKNFVRPLGLYGLGQPCLISMGVAIPWPQFQQLTLASGNLVEDMQMGIDLALNGSPAQFCPRALVTGLLPQSDTAALSQRTRWEQGHLQTLKQQVPRLLAAAWRQHRIDLLSLALELSVPPLTVLVLLLLASLGLSALAWSLGLATWWPFALLAVAGVILLVTVLGAWYQFCRALIPAQFLLGIPLYIVWKLPLYFKFLIKPQTQWIRTERDPPLQ
jgi:cellulose synthase/poly-beta-1,6-N-acetylglucosamine synthase-like glycosyltransferase